MSDISGMTVTLHALNAFLAPGRESARFPAILVPAFCEAVGDDRPLRFLLGDDLTKLLELGECVASLLSDPAAMAKLKVRRRSVPIDIATLLPLFTTADREKIV